MTISEIKNLLNKPATIGDAFKEARTLPFNSLAERIYNKLNEDYIVAKEGKESFDVIRKFTLFLDSCEFHNYKLPDTELSVFEQAHLPRTAKNEIDHFYFTLRDRFENPVYKNFLYLDRNEQVEKFTFDFVLKKEKNPNLPYICVLTADDVHLPAAFADRICLEKIFDYAYSEFDLAKIDSGTGGFLFKLRRAYEIKTHDDYALVWDKIKQTYKEQHPFWHIRLSGEYCNDKLISFLSQLTGLLNVDYTGFKPPVVLITGRLPIKAINNSNTADKSFRNRFISFFNLKQTEKNGKFCQLDTIAIENACKQFVFCTIPNLPFIKNEDLRNWEDNLGGTLKFNLAQAEPLDNLWKNHDFLREIYHSLPSKT